MPFIEASMSSVLAFVAIVLFVTAMLVWMMTRGNPPRSSVTTVLAVLALWLSGLTVLVASGRMPELPMSGLPFFFGTVMVVWVWLGASATGARVAAAVPIAVLVGFQAFRLPLELVLHSWVSQGTISETMTWTGQNFDIISGVVALVAAPFATRSRAIAWVANIVGSVLLLNVMRVALLSAPVPFGWNVQPPLLVALHLPYMFIGPICVGAALFGHIVLTRCLMSNPSNPSNPGNL